MTKISNREMRALKREVLQLRKKVFECERNRTQLNKKIKTIQDAHICQTSKLKNHKKILEMNVRKLHKMFLKQQKVIHQQQSDILENCKRNPQLSASDSNLECAKSMISMSQQVCRECLGARTILKSKKNIRYSADCKSCQ